MLEQLEGKARAPVLVADDVYVFGATHVQTRTTMKELRSYLQAYGLSLQPERCSWATTMQGEAPYVMDVDGQRIPLVQEMTVLGTLVSFRHAGPKAMQHRIRMRTGGILHDLAVAPSLEGN